MWPDKIKHFDKILGIEKAYKRVIPAGLERAGFKPAEVSTTNVNKNNTLTCLLYTSPSPRDQA